MTEKGPHCGAALLPKPLHILATSYSRITPGMCKVQASIQWLTNATSSTTYRHPLTWQDVVEHADMDCDTCCINYQKNPISSPMRGNPLAAPQRSRTVPKVEPLSAPVSFFGFIVLYLTCVDLSQSYPGPVLVMSQVLPSAKFY